MIDIDGRTYPSEVRASAAPPPRPDQQVPAGLSLTGGDPAVSLLESDRTMVSGQAIHAGEPGPNPQLTQDRAEFGGRFPGPLVQGTAAARDLAPGETTGDRDAVSGPPVRPYGSVRDPGSGETYENPNAPTVPDATPASPLEIQAARAMMEEAEGLYPGFQVIGFVRYPNDKRIMMKFREKPNDDDIRSLQRTY